jgi:hypothetical protein
MVVCYCSACAVFRGWQSELDKLLQAETTPQDGSVVFQIKQKGSSGWARASHNGAKVGR